MDLKEIGIAEAGQGLGPARGYYTPFQPLGGFVKTPWCLSQLTPFARGLG